MKFILLIFICFILSGLKDNLLLDKTVPTFSGLTLDNKKIDSTFYKGKVTVINFWSIGCKPCMKELPFLEQLDSIFPDETFQILSIAPHSRERLAAFNSDKPSQYSGFRKAIGAKTIKFSIMPQCELTKRNPNDSATLLTLAFDCEEISKLFGVDLYPSTFIVDKDGVIRHIHFGYPMEESDSEYKKMLTKEIQNLLI
jgi:thiol-disulfide isomerase/thioredoxin